MRDPRWDQIFIPGGKGGIPPPKAGSRHSHLGSWVGLPGSRLYPTWHFTWVSPVVMPPGFYCCKRGCSAVYWDYLLLLSRKAGLWCLQKQSTIAWGGCKGSWSKQDCLLPGRCDQEVHVLDNLEFKILLWYYINKECTNSNCMHSNNLQWQWYSF